MDVDAEPERCRSIEHAHTFRVRADQSYSEATVAAVAAVSGRSPLPMAADTESDVLRPLYEYLDPDALDNLLDRDIPSLRVTFTYADHEVTIDGNGVVIVTES